MLTELDARDRVAQRHREAAEQRRIRAVYTPIPLRVRLGDRLVRLGETLGGRGGPRPSGHARPVH